MSDWVLLAAPQLRPYACDLCKRAPRGPIIDTRQHHVLPNGLPGDRIYICKNCAGQAAKLHELIAPDELDEAIDWRMRIEGLEAELADRDQIIADFYTASDVSRTTIEQLAEELEAVTGRADYLQSQLDRVSEVASVSPEPEHISESENSPYEAEIADMEAEAERKGYAAPRYIREPDEDDADSD